jgi:hypothetical protein
MFINAKMRSGATNWSPAKYLVLTLVWLLWAAGGWGAVRFDVFVGYDSQIPEASWFPITFEVANDGPSFNAVVEVTPGQFNQGQERRMAVELPTGTTKRFVIPVFSSSHIYSMGSWDARLLDERGRVRAESLNMRPKKQYNWRVPMFGAVSKSPIPMPTLATNANRPYEWQPAVSRLQPNLFPENPLALEGLSTIYLNSEKALDLKVNQVNALMAWLYAGGHLVVGVEQSMHIAGNEWLRQLLPCELTGMTTRTAHRELQEWLQSNRLQTGKDFPFANSGSTISTPSPSSGVTKTRINSGTPTAVVNAYATLGSDAEFEAAPMQVATGTLRDGSVLMGTKESPLAIIAARGLGQITVLTFAAEMEPFLSWKNRPWFWAKLLGYPPEMLKIDRMDTYNATSIDGVLGTLIDTKQVRKLPVGWLLLLLVGYLVVIGPLDRYWLKKINRQMLTWLTFPAYVAGFSILIYVIGYKLRAGETEWNELQIVDVVPMGAKAELRGHTYASVYSPANARYKLASDQPFAALRGEYRTGQESSKATVEQRGGSFNAEIFVPVWTSQLYVGDWLRQDDPPLTFTATSQGSRITVKIDNHLDKPITQTRLVLDNRIFTISNVPPRKTSEFTLQRETGMALGSFVQSYGSNFRYMADQRQQAFGRSPGNYDVTNSVIAASFVSQLNPSSRQPQYDGYVNTFITTPGLDLSPIVDRGQPVLLAWVPDFTVVQAMNRFSTRRTHHDTLLRIAGEAPKPLN